MTEAVFNVEDGITDPEWLELVREASGDGQRFFTENQLYLAYARNKVQISRYIARRGVLGLVMIVVGLGTWVYALKVDWGITLVVGIAITLGGVACVGTGVVTRRDPAAREPVSRWLGKWQAERQIDKLVAGPALARAGAEYLPARVDAVVIVQRDALVDLLLMNDAQHELSALIVAESGYPEALAAAARRLLGERSDLRVIVLHDATSAGVGMRARLHKSSAFPLEAREALDIGLFPADVTWLAELAPAIPSEHTSQVPVDSLSFDALLRGLRGVMAGALSLHAGIDGAPDQSEQGAS
ncbi:MAG TPA: hypothetical protein VF294_06180 [Polyangiaceae bacterium]